MNKQELFDRVDAFISTHGYVPVNVRVHFDKNYGLDRQADGQSLACGEIQRRRNALHGD